MRAGGHRLGVQGASDHCSALKEIEPQRHRVTGETGPIVSPALIVTFKLALIDNFDAILPLLSDLYPQGQKLLRTTVFD